MISTSCCLPSELSAGVQLEQREGLCDILDSLTSWHFRLSLLSVISLYLRALLRNFPHEIAERGSLYVLATVSDWYVYRKCALANLLIFAVLC